VVQERALLSPLHEKTEDLAKQVRELQTRVPKQSSMVSETIIYPHEDHISYLEDSLQQFCERFLGGLTRRRGALQPRALVVQRMESMTEGFITGAADESRYAAETSAQTVLEAAEQVDAQAPIQIEQQEVQQVEGEVTREIVACEEVQQVESEVTREVVASEGLQVVSSPELTAEEDAQLKQIFGNKRIELVIHGGSDPDAGDHVASLILNDLIQFKPVHHGNTPKAEFRHPEKVHEMLKDVSEILKIYRNAVLNIEGHTATPPEKMDQWAHDLADNRAAAVKETIVSFGVDSSRLMSIGMPGNLGSGKVDTKLKIMRF